MIDRFKRFSYLVTETNRCMRKLENDVMSKVELKGYYAVYLLALYRNPKGLSAVRLAEICGRNKADVSRSIADLLEKDLIKKSKNTRGYRTPIILTEKGIEYALMLESSVELAIKKVSSGIPSGIISEFYDTFEIICSNLRMLSDNGLEPTL